MTIGPTLASIALGVVGSDRFARQAGRNEAFFHLGDGSIGLVILLAAPFLGNPVLFWTMGFTAIATVAAAAAVPASAINHGVGRGLLPGAAGRSAGGRVGAQAAAAWPPSSPWRCAGRSTPCPTTRLG